MTRPELDSSRPRILILIKGLGIGGAERLISEGSRFWSTDEFDYRVAYVLPWKDHLVPDLAANGIEAVDMLKQFEYDIVFMDCQMPEMDGFEATQEIRKYENNNDKARTSIVALTADAMTGDRNKCLKSGMDGYLNKPVRAKEIADMLEKWVGT